MKTVIYGIGHLKALYWDDVDIIFFDDAKWWVKKDTNSQREPIDIDAFKPDYTTLNQEKVASIVNELVAWLPIWNRWIGHGDQYQLLLRKASIEILHIASGIEKLGIKHAIFQTSVTHHIPTLLFEKASIFCNLSPIFTYLDVISNRFILFQHKHNPADRKALQYNITDFEASECIEAFVDNRLLNQAPKNDVVRHKRHFSLFYGLFYALIKHTMIHVRNRLLYHKKTPYFRTYPFQNSLQILQQYNAMKFYKKHITKLDTLLHDTTKPKLLIAAHFQPEATSFPEGWEMSNHIDIVMKLKMLGYSDEILYKEHPSSLTYVTPIVGLTKVGMYRSKAYYEQLLSLGCKFIEIDAPLPLESEDYLPVTITGTIAVERSLLGLSTIVMGHPWYKGLPGTIHIDDITSLAQIDTGYLKPNKEVAKKAKVFLNNLLSHSTLNSLDRLNGNKYVDKENLTHFKQEFDALLTHLVEEKR